MCTRTVPFASDGGRQGMTQADELALCPRNIQKLEHNTADLMWLRLCSSHGVRESEGHPMTM